MSTTKTIAVDFDGTCVTHAYPELGLDIGAVPVLKQLIAHGHKLILYTMRSSEYLEAAEQWFKNHNINLYAVNENPSQKSWSLSPKVYAHLYIDDAALGCPLIYNNEISDRPFVDWKAVEELLKRKLLISSLPTVTSQEIEEATVAPDTDENFEFVDWLRSNVHFKNGNIYLAPTLFYTLEELNISGYDVHSAYSSEQCYELFQIIQLKQANF